MKSMHNKYSLFINYPLILFIFLLIVFTCNTFSQTNVVDTSDVKKKDSIFFKLKFLPGDTLVYKVISTDSIIIDFGKPLLKSRTERFRIICDSVSKDEHYYLTIALIESISKESQGNEKNLENSNPPWLNRKIRLVIDSVGTRISGFSFDSLNPALCPGGAFQPYLIFPINASQKAVNESWIATSLDELYENGLPVPLLKQSSLFRAKGIIDTLGDKCSRIEFIKTGQGNIPVVTENDKFNVTNIISGFGVMDISATRNIPVHFYATLEQKLTLHFPNNVTKPGLHYINSYFTLESVKHKKTGNNYRKNRKGK